MKLIILAGGSGTRLFPLSRSCYPKQFLKVGNDKSLLQQTVLRFSHFVSPENIVIVTGSEYIFHAQADLREIGATKAHIVTEPIGRNTAPAIALALAYCQEELGADEKEVLFVTPADHFISPQDKFAALALEAAKCAAEREAIVTIGIEPTRPDTGYGYIEAVENDQLKPLKVKAFHEKPDEMTAKEYLASGGYYWNAGMFVFPLGVMAAEIAHYMPEIAQISDRGYIAALHDFSRMPSISIDYAVAEKSQRMLVMPMQGIYWNDIGSFDAIEELLAKQGKISDDGCVTGDGCIVKKDTKNCMIIGSERLIAAIGVEDIMVVDTPDALLICKKECSQEVKSVVGELKAKGRKEPDENVTMYRPWGAYTVLVEGDGYKVKRIIINPGQSLSYQMHYHRSEHWTVISGIGRMILDEKEMFVRENESIYIPIATRHRLENPGILPLVIIEVQNGKYLGEDDIVRFEDIYGRRSGTDFREDDNAAPAR